MIINKIFMGIYGDNGLSKLVRIEGVATAWKDGPKYAGFAVAGSFWRLQACCALRSWNPSCHSDLLPPESRSPSKIQHGCLKDSKWIIPRFLPNKPTPEWWIIYNRFNRFQMIPKCSLQNRHENHGFPEGIHHRAWSKLIQAAPRSRAMDSWCWWWKEWWFAALQCTSPGSTHTPRLQNKHMYIFKMYINYIYILYIYIMYNIMYIYIWKYALYISIASESLNMCLVYTNKSAMSYTSEGIRTMYIHDSETRNIIRDLTTKHKVWAVNTCDVSR